MANLTWQERHNLEDSLKEFLESEITSQNISVFYEGNNLDINIGVGFAESNIIPLPNILVYCDTKSSDRAFIGGNKRFKEWLMIIDIRALHDGMRSDLAEWVQETINNGFNYYEYSPNSSNPDNPIKTLAGVVELSFISDTPVRLNNVSSYDKYRHNITISVDINGGGV